MKVGFNFFIRGLLSCHPVEVTASFDQKSPPDPVSVKEAPLCLLFSMLKRLQITHLSSIAHTHKHKE